MKRAAIIGAGLAGTACAYALKQRGFEPVIYEAGSKIAPGASGNVVGLYNPRLSAERTLYADAFELALETFPKLKNIGWNPWGSLHLITDEKRENRYHQAVKNWGMDDMRIVKAKEASNIAGIEITKECLWLPRSGVVSPKDLCAVYAKDIEVHFNTDIQKLSDVKADIIIVANGMNARNFEETKDLPLRGVRGQITFAAPTEKSANIKCNLCYGGYATPPVNNAHAIGSTFQRWLDHDQIIEHDDEQNIEKLARAIPALAGDYKIIGHRAAVRTTTNDHFPIFGCIKDHIYVSTGHGSHGILTSLWAANRLADDIHKVP